LQGFSPKKALPRCRHPPRRGLCPPHKTLVLGASAEIGPRGTPRTGSAGRPSGTGRRSAAILHPGKRPTLSGLRRPYWVEDKMRLRKDRTALVVNPSLTLAGIPPETFQYRLGNRSALEWVIDQYQMSEDKRSGIRSDPNRIDDKDYIVRLVGQVVQVSLKTVAIIDQLPQEFI
jgi:hypothetical protein